MRATILILSAVLILIPGISAAQMHEGMHGSGAGQQHMMGGQQMMGQGMMNNMGIMSTR